MRPLIFARTCVESLSNWLPVVYLSIRILNELQLTYCSPVWRPHLIEDMKTLEKVQHTRYSRTNKSRHFYFECSTYLRPHIYVSCQSCYIHHFSLLQPFSRSLQLITPLHILLSMSLSLHPLSTSLTQLSFFIYKFYPLILYIWGPDTLSGLPSVHPLLTTSHNCFNPIVCTVKSNNNNNNNNSNNNFSGTQRR